MEQTRKEQLMPRSCRRYWFNIEARDGTDAMVGWRVETEPDVYGARIDRVGLLLGLKLSWAKQ
ncbi:hypothetical protein C5167_007912 [Papaver somniferum]|nr:hypothetical protein C5167_007912 [Papaver somniferum]